MLLRLSNRLPMELPDLFLMNLPKAGANRDEVWVEIGEVVGVAPP